MMSHLDATKSELDVNYVVFVTKRNGIYNLAIPELLLQVCDSDIEKAYAELAWRKQHIIDYARALGSLDELPLPVTPPLRLPDRTASFFQRAFQGLFRR